MAPAIGISFVHIFSGSTVPFATSSRRCGMYLRCGQLPMRSARFLCIALPIGKFSTFSRDGNFQRVECAYGAFERTLALPEDADRDKIDASFKNGILTVIIPRDKSAKPSSRQISIRHS